MAHWPVEVELAAHGRPRNAPLAPWPMVPLGPALMARFAQCSPLFREVGQPHSADPVLCCVRPGTQTDRATYALRTARRLQEGLRPARDASKSYEDNEHDVAAREFFARHGYRTLTEAQSNAITLIGTVRPGGR
jgi:hypothetical protein